MVRSADWSLELESWVAERFLAPLRNAPQRRAAPLYLRGLLGPSERKSLEPMAAAVAPGHAQSLHHFVSVAHWDEQALGCALVAEASRLVGGEEAVLIVDDTALRKHGRHSVGVARQWCGEIGAKANCQVLVSLTLAHGQVPVPVALRLYLPQEWADAPERRLRAGVPEEVVFEDKWRLALREIDRVRQAGARFGLVAADAGYGAVHAFRHGLSERGLPWIVGVPGDLLAYPKDVRLEEPPPRAGRTGAPATRLRPSALPQRIEDIIGALPERAWREITWRRGTKGPLRGPFACVRVRLADQDEPKLHRGLRAPGEELWLLAQRRPVVGMQLYLSNLPATASRRTLARAARSRWVCEQAHQQMKNELGLDHFEGRSWPGLHRHALMTMISMAFLQHLRLRARKKNARGTARRRRPRCPRCGAA